MLVNRKGSSNATINKLIIDNNCYTDKQSICEQLNTYYINVGKNLASKLPTHHLNPTDHIIHKPSNSFMLHAVTPQEVEDIISNLKDNKAFIGPPIKCIKLASSKISSSLAAIFNQSFNQSRNCS